MTPGYHALEVITGLPDTPSLKMEQPTSPQDQPEPMEEDVPSTSGKDAPLTPTPVKRGRGRPPKKHAPEQQPQPEPDKPKRPRGRPPGVSMEELLHLFSVKNLRDYFWFFFN